MRVAKDECLYRECQALLDLPEFKTLNDITIMRNGISWNYNKVFIYLQYPFLCEVLKDSDLLIFVEEFTDDRDINADNYLEDLKEATSRSLYVNEATSGTFSSFIGQQSSYLCPVCGKEFTEKRKYLDHCGRNQSKENLVCGLCKRPFCSQANLKQHQLTHVEGTHYSCTICLMKFKHQRNLTVHLKQHSTQTKFECSKCLKLFSCIQNLKRHEKKIHSP